jgi:DNA-binding MarR family transcriptional regulator
MRDPRELMLALGDVVSAVERNRLAVSRAALGMGGTEIVTLGELAVQGPRTPTQIADRAQLGSPSVTALIDRLEHGGLVTRVPHPSDRRKVLVKLTDTGHRIAGLLAGQARTAIQRCTAELTDDEYRLVLRFLRQTVIEFLHLPEPRAGDHRAAPRGTPTRSQPGPGSPPGWEGHSQSLTGECC